MDDEFNAEYNFNPRRRAAVWQTQGFLLQNIIGQDATYTVVDISSASLELTRRLVANPSVKYVLCDVFKFQPPQKFDFITIGEVLEHLEDPQAMLRHVAHLLTDDGTLFITTPTNAPAIDHIYLFNNADEIRQLINAAGYNIVSEFTRYAEDVTPEFAEKHKVASHYGAILKIKK